MKEQESLLSPYRVLDLVQGTCLIAGKMLADLGANVIKIEKPGGDATRNIGPFYKDIPDPEKSLFWFAYNTNKRGITLDIETADGKELFKELAKKADLVIETFPPGYMDELRLGYSALSQLNPGIIVTSITPYGQTGPKAHYKSSELTSWASGVSLDVSGDPDRPPVGFSFPHAFLHGGAEGAAASLVALWHRELTGEGQHVDVSIQECAINVSSYAPLYWSMGKRLIKRQGSALVVPHASLKVGYPCKDGYTSAMIMGGGYESAVHSSQALVQWMDEEGVAPQWLKDLDWVNDYDTSKLTQDLVDRVEETIGKFFLTKTKAELYDEALKRKLLIAPVNTTKDIWESPHLKVREFWVEVEHPELDDTLTYCGPAVKLSIRPLPIWRRAPLIGEHNEEIYCGELSLSKDRLILLKQAGVI